MHAPPPAYILAGGRSTRFGSDKARAVLSGVPLLLRQARHLELRGHRVTVVASHTGAYDDMGLTTIGDIEPERGPVGGLRTALRNVADGWLVLTCCDLLTLSDARLRMLSEHAREEPRPPAAVFREDRWQPFPGLYHTALLARPELWRFDAFQSLLDAIGAHPLHAPEDSTRLRQANTPEALRRYEIDPDQS